MSDVPTPHLPEPPALRLYSFHRSGASWRVRIGLALKRLRYEYVAVDISKKDGEQLVDAYAEKNPMRQVPTLEIVRPGGVERIGQSMAILEWLEDYFPALPILPSDLGLRARARMIAEMSNAGIQPLHNTSVLRHLKSLGQDPDAWSKHFLARGLAALESAVQPTAGRYCVGDQPTLADVCLVPQLGTARRYALDLAAYPTLVRIDATCAEQPAFQAAHPDRQPDAPK